VDKLAATTIVKEINPDITDAVLSDLLESSKGILALQAAYRPYVVAAYSLFTNPPNGNLKRGDVAEWFDWRPRAYALLSLQESLDSGITNITDNWQVAKVKELIKDPCECDSKGGAVAKHYAFAATFVKG
jgi:hypothetical protein